MIETKPNSWSRAYTVSSDEGTDKKVLTPSSTTTTISKKWVDFRQGVDLPKYLEVIANGGDATTAFSASRQDVLAVAPANFEVKYRKTGYGFQTPVFTNRLTGEYMINGFNSDSGSAAAISSDNQALTNTFARIRNAKSEVNGLAILGELHQTIGMLKSPLSSLRKGILSHMNTWSLRAGKLRRGVNPNVVKKMTADTYLEFVFGVMPFINDINGVIRAMSKNMNRPRRVRFLGKGESKSTRILTGSNQTAGGYLRYRYEKVLTVTSSTRYFIGYAVPTVNVPLSRLDALGLNLESLAPAMWEVLPWSWLFDYFANVGDIIEAYTDLSGSPTYCCKVVKTIRDSQMNMFPHDAAIITQLGSNELVSITGTPGSSLCQSISIERSRATLKPPALELRIPTYWKQWVNMAAVSSQRLDLNKQISAVRKLVRRL